MHTYPPGHLGLNDFAELFVGPALVLVIAGWLLWRKKRRAQAYDLALWFCLSFLVLCYVALRGKVLTEVSSLIDRQLVGGCILVMLAAVLAGCVVSGLRIWRQKVAIDMAFAYLMVPFLFAMYVALAPSMGTHAEHYRSNWCKFKLRELGVAMHDEYGEQKQLPPTSAGDPAVSWRVRLLPRLDQATLYHKYNQAVPWNASRM